MFYDVDEGWYLYFNKNNKVQVYHDPLNKENKINPNPSEKQVNQDNLDEEEDESSL